MFFCHVNFLLQIILLMPDIVGKFVSMVVPKLH